jgi:phospholipase D1/2
VRSGARQYERYQAAAAQTHDQTWDSVAACYMDAGPDLHSAQWHGPPEAEIDAYVSEELYIHSKLLIADDKLVICGSANLNDRSQLGAHDSEIAVVIEDPTPVASSMGGAPFTASAFAASLRRQIFRKHLGLLPHQACDRPDANWSPVDRQPNHYDWGSPADRLVADPVSYEFQNLWAGTARTNTEVFSKVFHNVPNDHVRTWEDYDNFFSKHFIIPGAKEPGDTTGKVEYGHVVREEFPGGVAEVKDWLRRVRGSLVEMPLGFLAGVDDIAKEGLSLNALTDELYT